MWKLESKAIKNVTNPVSHIDMYFPHIPGIYSKIIPNPNTVLVLVGCKPRLKVQVQGRYFSDWIILGKEVHTEITRK